MVSAIVDLSVRSMVTVSSAFISSRHARTRRRISSAVGRTLAFGRTAFERTVLGRTLETDSAARWAPARETAGVGRVPFLSLPFATTKPLAATTAPREAGRRPKIGTGG